MWKNKERKPMTYRPIFAKLPRSTLCSYHNREHQNKQELGIEQSENDATGEDEADRRINSVDLKQYS